MRFLLQMRQHQPLPVSFQIVLPTVHPELQTAALRQWLQQQVYFGIVAQRFVVPHALYRLGNGFLIGDLSGIELHLHAEPVGDQPLQYFQLHLSHQLHLNLSGVVVPHHVESRIFLLQLCQLFQGIGRVHPFRQLYAVAEHRFQHRSHTVAGTAQPLPDKRPAQTRHRTDRARRDRLFRLELRTGVDTDLADFFLHVPAVGSSIGDAVPPPQPSAGDLQVTQPVPLFVSGNFKHPRPELCRTGLFQRIPVQSLQKCVHALQLQRCPEVTGDQLPAGNAFCQQFRRDLPLLQISIHERLLQQSHLFIKGIGAVCGKVHTAVTQPALQLFQHCRLVCPCQVHFVDKEEHRHLIAFQQFPQGFRVGLHAVCAADDQNGIVQYLHSAFSFC